MTNLLTSLSDNIVVDVDRCTGCGICEAKCPVQPEAAITVKEGVNRLKLNMG